MRACDNESPLPPRRSWDETVGDYYYFESDTGRSQWSHPLDEVYRTKVQEARESPAEDGADMDLMRPPPGKLAPLPPLGKPGRGGSAAGKKALPPLKKPPMGAEKRLEGQAYGARAGNEQSNHTTSSNNYLS